MSTLSELYSSANAQLKMSDMIPLTADNYPEAAKMSGLKMSYEELCKLIAEEGMDIRCLYITTKGTNLYWYINGYSYIGLPTIEPHILSSIKVAEVSRKQNETLSKFWLKKDYESFFGLFNESFVLEYFIKHMNLIPQDKLYKVFRRIYTKIDYGFNEIDKQTMERILTTNRDTRFRSKLNPNQKGYVTVFRGVDSKSTGIKEAYSWTTSFETAVYFALRFDGTNSKIYKAKIHIDHIIDYIEDRDEHEVILLPKNLTNVEDMGFLNFNERFVALLETKNVIEDYNHLKSYLNDELFDNPKGIHGMLHAKRVLLLSLILSYLEKLNRADTEVLAFASLYHDIGRYHDGKCYEHGIFSVNRIEDEGIDEMIPLESTLEAEDIEIMKSVIRNHARPDQDGISDIMEDEGITNKDRAVKLYRLFKDADNLDRVRLGDLDVRYLRSKFSKKLVLVAHQFLKEVR